MLAKRLGARKCIIINPGYKQKLIELKSLFQYENEIKHWLELWSLEKIYIMYKTSGNLLMILMIFAKRNIAKI